MNTDDAEATPKLSDVGQPSPVTERALTMVKALRDCSRELAGRGIRVGLHAVDSGGWACSPTTPRFFGDVLSDEVVSELLAYTEGLEGELEFARGEVGRAGLRAGHVVEDVDEWRASVDAAADAARDDARERGKVALALGCMPSEVVESARKMREEVELHRRAAERLRAYPMSNVDVLEALDAGLARLEAGS